MESFPTKNIVKVESPEDRLNVDVTLRKEEIEKITDDPNHAASDIIRLFNRDFQQLYEADAGTIERYQLGVHTRMVLRQFIKYFGAKELPQVSKAFFESFLALHDIGKPYAAAEDDIEKQYEYTTALLANILPQMGFSEEELKIAKSLVNGDPIRKYLYKRDSDVDAIAQEIVQKAGDANMTVEDFWDLLLIFWKSDAASYTADAGGKASLDRMFEFEPDYGELYLAPHVETRIEALKERTLAVTKDDLVQP